MDIKCVTFREDFFRGHFPKEPVMPGVLMVEALAQVGAVAILSLEDMKENCLFRRHQQVQIPQKSSSGRQAPS